MNLKKLLIPGRKYTILRFDSKGWLYSVQFTLAAVTYKNVEGELKYTLVAAGNPDVLKWDKWIKLEHHQQFVIWEGFHKVNTDMCVSRGTLDGDHGLVTVEKRWTGDNPRYLERAIKELGQQSVAQYLEPMQPEVLITYQCIS